MATQANPRENQVLRQLHLEAEQRIAFAHRYGYTILPVTVSGDTSYTVIHKDHVIASCNLLHDASRVAAALATYSALTDLMLMRSVP